MSDLNGITIDEIHESFEFLEDWDDRFRFLLDLSAKIPPMRDEDKTDDNRVRGCQSTVWLKARPSADSPPHIDIAADSNAFIVKGLIAILLVLYSGRTAEEILAVDADQHFRDLGLDSHLSPTRRNGLHAMVNRIRAIAGEIAAQP